MFPPRESILHVNFTIHGFQGGKTLVFPPAGEMFIFAVRSQSGTFAWAFHEDRSWFSQYLPPFCFHFTFPYLIIG